MVADGVVAGGAVVRRGSPTGRSRLVVLLVVSLAVLTLAGCAAGPNELAGGSGADVAGFWQGLWHGIIIPVTFVISLFSDDVNIYEVNNTGNWYDFGFMIGIGGFAAGGGGASRMSRRG